ncbi:Protein of unknown function [Planctomicrobium piriforme]|uniref:DUF721 domain-containing protein n=2 Tax=Planctomicrobium piriforme TaxID=1576369 RepID=A0A1I3FWT5_9PLAN|nr:Protein of unknown function [Planctomicrobium piriforme]
MERARPYDTSEPDTLGSVLSKLFALRGYGRPQAGRVLQELWTSAAEPALLAQTKVLSLKNGVLQVGVSNSALLSELAAFRKMELLEILRKSPAGAKIRDLKFKLRGDLKTR